MYYNVIIITNVQMPVYTAQLQQQNLHGKAWVTLFTQSLLI